MFLVLHSILYFKDSNFICPRIFFFYYYRYFLQRNRVRPRHSTESTWRCGSSLAWARRTATRATTASAASWSGRRRTPTNTAAGRCAAAWIATSLMCASRTSWATRRSSPTTGRVSGGDEEGGWRAAGPRGLGKVFS